MFLYNHVVLQLEGITTATLDGGEIEAICNAMGFPAVTIDWSSSISGHVQASSNSSTYEFVVLSTWLSALAPTCNTYLFLSCVAETGTRLVGTALNFTLLCPGKFLVNYCSEIFNPD
jgi:hypothetical protein